MLPASPLDASPSTVRTILRAAQSVKTPIQLASFVIAIVTTIILFQSNPSTNVLVFTALLLPFVLLIAVFNEKVLKSLEQPGPFWIAGSAMIAALLLSGYVAFSLIKASHGALLDTPDVPILAPDKKVKVQRIRDAQFRIGSYIDSQKLVVRYYSRALGDCLGGVSPNIDVCDDAVRLKAEFESLTQKALALRASALHEIYGNDSITELFLKLDRCVLSMPAFTAEVERTRALFLRIVGPTAAGTPLDEVLKSLGPGGTPPKNIEAPRFFLAVAQTDFLRALGPEIAYRPLDQWTAAGLANVKAALARLGYADEAASSQNDSDAVRRFRASLSAYFTVEQTALPYTTLLVQGRQQAQVSAMLALSDAGLLDFGKFIVKYAPESARKALQGVLKTPVPFFNPDNANTLTEALVDQRGGRLNDGSRSTLVALRIRDDLQDAFKVSGIGKPSSPDNVEQLLLQSVKQESELKSFGGQLRILGSSVSEDSRYFSLLQELRTYCNVYEMDLLLKALES